MPRTLMWLLRQKTLKMHFLPVSDLISDRLTTTWIKPHQCPSHQFVLLAQGLIPEIIVKSIENWVFWVGQIEIVFDAKLYKVKPHQSILPTQGPIHEFFTILFLRIGHFEKLSFWVSHFEILHWKKQLFFFFASSLWKSVKATWVSRMGHNFDDYPGLQQKSKCAY